MPGGCPALEQRNPQAALQVEKVCGVDWVMGIGLAISCPGRHGMCLLVASRSDGGRRSSWTSARLQMLPSSTVVSQSTPVIGGQLTHLLKRVEDRNVQGSCQSWGLGQ